MNNRLIRKKPNRFLYGRNNYFGIGGTLPIEDAILVVEEFATRPDLDLNLRGRYATRIDSTGKFMATNYMDAVSDWFTQNINNFQPLIKIKNEVPLPKTPLPPSSLTEGIRTPELTLLSIVKTGNSNVFNKLLLNEQLLKGVSTAVGLIGGNIIGGGLLSGVGNTISGLSGLASAIPGPAGAIASSGLGILGGVANKMFGSKLNEGNIAKVELNINLLNSFLSNASNYDNLTSNYLSAPVGMTFDNDYIGKDGWFSNKAKNKANDLRLQVNTGNTWVQNSLANNALNILNLQMTNLLSNYAAYGGLLYGKGGTIHIKPSKRGTFTAAATKHGMGVQEFASRVLANKDNYSPAMVKKANFARNASKWHAEGGPLMSNGAIFDTGIGYIGNGGTHEENPYEGVPMGIDEEGTPNLVEEGEVIWNDYVFSNRLKVPKAVRKKYKLRGTKNLTFADAALQFGKEAEERPNDPISLEGLNVNMNNLMLVLELIRVNLLLKLFRNGGNLFDTGGTWNQPLNYNNSTSISDFPANYYNEDGSLNFDLVYGNNSPFMEKRGYIINNWDSPTVQQWLPTYVNSVNTYNTNRTGYTPVTLDNLTKDIFTTRTSDRNWGGMHLGILGFTIPQLLAATLGESASAVSPSTNTPITPLDRRFLMGYDASGMPINTPINDYDPSTGTYLWVRTNKNVKEGDNLYNDYYYLAKPEKEPVELSIGNNYPNYDSWLRYMPVVGSAIGAASTLLSDPNYGDALSLIEASRRGNYLPVRYTPIGNYLTYRPIDRDYFINRLNALANASRRAALNTAIFDGNRGNAVANLLALDNNYINSLGDLLPQIDLLDFTRRKDVETFNRETNSSNSAGSLEEAKSNLNAINARNDLLLKGLVSAYDLKYKERLARELAISSNLTNIFNSLGSIGEEGVNRLWRTWAAEHGLYAPVQEVKLLKNGGKIKRNKRKGLTF